MHYLKLLEVQRTEIHHFINTVSKQALLGKKWQAKDSSIKNKAYDYSKIESPQVNQVFVIPLGTKRGLKIPHKCSIWLLLARQWSQVDLLLWEMRE